MVKHGKLLLFLAKITGIGKRTLFNLKVDEIEGASSTGDFISIARNLAAKNKRIHIPGDDELLEYIYSAEAILASHEKQGISMITKYDLEYPRNLVDIPIPAPYFFIKGSGSVLQQFGIAVVGTRQPSDYGRRIAERLGEFVAEQGGNVISGLAQGCDTAAHRGCLNRQGITIAVMGTPLDTVYPVSNTELLEQILSTGGCIISEYPVGSTTSHYAFVERDRLQCGLANGVIIAETGNKGGTMHAVNGAIRLQRLIGCFSYSEEHYAANIQSLGNRQLIVDGRAVALRERESIEEFIGNCRINSSGCRERLKQSNLF